MGLEQDMNFGSVEAMNRQLFAVNSYVSSAFLGQNIESSFKGQPKDYRVLQLKFHSCPIIFSKLSHFQVSLSFFPGRAINAGSSCRKISSTIHLLRGR